MNIGIIGAGTMGSGIAQVVAQHGHETIVYDTSQDVLDRAQSRLGTTMEKLVGKGKFTDEESQKIQKRISWANDFQKLATSHLVIEAIVENLEIKQKVFKDLEGIVSQDCILASNTSSLSLTSIAAACSAPERFIGIHFFNPAPIMKLVEIIPALQTDRQVLASAKKLIDSWGKVTVIAKDTPGFIVNKVARPFYSEGIKMLEEGIADARTIDWVLTQEDVGFRMGPFTLTDLIGHDINYKVTETVWQSFYYDPRYKPSFTQKRLVEANWLGRKSGKGFYQYPAKENAEIVIEVNTSIKEEIKDRVIFMLINEAVDTLFLNIASRDDIDNAMKFGVNYPKGLLAWADELGIDNCVKYLDTLYAKFGDDRYRCCPLLRTMATANKNFY